MSPDLLTAPVTLKRAHATRIALGTWLTFAAFACLSSQVKADEGGVGFWVPGFFGSLAAVPQTPGFSFANVFIHNPVTAGGNVAFARQVARGNITTNFRGNLDVSLKGRADLYLAAPTYVFETTIFGGRPAISLAIPYGRSFGSVDATLTGIVGPIGFTRSGSASDAITGFGDPSPMFNINWNAGVHNYMTYVSANIPIGRYDAARLANLGLGHQSLDAGAGYTYFNPQTGNEFSAVLGFTYNFENTHTQYQNGIDMHLDLAASKFVTKQWQIGVVGYAYQQISCDTGAGNRLGCFESRTFGIGPQIGYVIPMGNLQGYVNLKGYKDFETENRASGWSAWLTFAISPAAPTETRPKASIIPK
jgi:hypothetical protein